MYICNSLIITVQQNEYYNPRKVNMLFGTEPYPQRLQEVQAMKEGSCFLWKGDSLHTKRLELLEIM
jgi:hypothetical protein